MRVVRHKINYTAYRPKIMMEDSEIKLVSYHPEGEEVNLEFQLDQDYKIDLKLTKLNAINLYIYLRECLVDCNILVIKT